VVKIMGYEIIWDALRIVENDLSVEFKGETKEQAKQFIIDQTDENLPAIFFMEDKFKRRKVKRKILGLINN
jgi:hypothetical protein